MAQTEGSLIYYPKHLDKNNLIYFHNSKKKKKKKSQWANPTIDQVLKHISAQLV